MHSLLRGGLLPGLLLLLAGCGDQPPASPTPPPRKATPTPKKPTPPVASVAAPAAVTPTPTAVDSRVAGRTPLELAGALAGDWPVLRSEHFAGLDLTKKIDGGNMPFEEFGFLELGWTERLCQQTKLEVWVYRMRDPVAAYGIFTYNRDVAAGCRLIADVGEEAFAYQGGVEFRAGPCYVQVQGLLPEATLLNLARAVAGEIKEAGATPALLAALPAEGRVPGSEKYFCGPLAFSSATTLAQDETVAKLAQGAEGFVARYESGGELILLRLADEAAAERAAAILKEKGKLPAGLVVQEGRAVASSGAINVGVRFDLSLLDRAVRAAGGAEVRPVTPAPPPAMPPQ